MGGREGERRGHVLLLVTEKLISDWRLEILDLGGLQLDQEEMKKRILLILDFGPPWCDPHCGLGQGLRILD